MISEEIIKAINREQVLYVIDCNSHIQRIPTSSYITYLCDNGSVFCYPMGNCSIDNVFETEEDAEEYLKYGNVTRTEKFPYVSWEEFCKGKSIKFTTKDNYSFTCEVAIISDLGKMIVIYKPLIKGDIFKEPLTRENYYKALDLAVKLFKGEEV